MKADGLWFILYPPFALFSSLSVVPLLPLATQDTATLRLTRHSAPFMLALCAVVHLSTPHSSPAASQRWLTSHLSWTSQHNDTSPQTPQALPATARKQSYGTDRESLLITTADDTRLPTTAPLNPVSLSPKTETPSFLSPGILVSGNSGTENSVNRADNSVHCQYPSVTVSNGSGRSVASAYTSPANVVNCSSDISQFSSTGCTNATTNYMKPNDTDVKDNSHVDIKLTVENCSMQETIPVFGKTGTITGLLGSYPKTAATTEVCHWAVHLPEGFQYLYALLTLPEDPCSEKFHMKTMTLESYLSRNLPSDQVWKTSCRQLSRQVFVKTKIYHFMLIDNIHNMAQSNPTFTVEFECYKEDLRKQLVVRSVTSSSGYITQWGYDGKKNHFCINDAYQELKVPTDHIVMVSFPRFDMTDWSDCPHVGLWLYSLPPDPSANTTALLAHYCGAVVIPARIYNFSLLFHFKTQMYCNYVRTGFKAFYSFAHVSEKPQVFDDFFNCSTVRYKHFQQHLDCNMEFECLEDEDEGGHCPYSSHRCAGLVSSGHKCYQYVFWDHHISSYAAQRECAQRYGDLAIMKSQSEWKDLKKLFQYGKRHKMALYGVRTGDSSFPDLYKYMLKWMDNSVAQNMHVLTQQPLLTSYHFDYERCGVLEYREKFEISFEDCHRDVHAHFICQVIVEQPLTASVVFPVITFPFSAANRTKQWLLPCMDGHVTHAFLLCDPLSQCHMDAKHVPECRLPTEDGGGGYFVVGMFACEDGVTTVTFTVVCDFRQDCPDGSDEAFCVPNSTCVGFLCHSGQCVDKGKRCNLDRDCLDESDEAQCEDELNSSVTRFIIPQVVRVPPPVIIDFSGHGHFSQATLRPFAACPSTHFGCADDYCLPVYVRCNAVKDCPGGEDERQCHLHNCAGFYQCRSSIVCVHADHMCDGWPQCPQHDEEWLCHMNCPDGCLCQGHAFRCPQSVSVSSFPLLRYLDASGSGMKPHDVTGLAYLVWLSLSRCGVRLASRMRLPNLRSLDLSRNQLTSLYIDVFLSLPNLKTLSFSQNFLTHFFIDYSRSKHGMLQSLDLSWNVLETLNANHISMFPEIRSLNISHCKVSVLHPGVFYGTAVLNQIDLRGNPLTSYPQDLFTSLQRLQHVWTDDYRLCCQQNLPSQFYAKGQCFSPGIHLSSCKDLLRYREHRVVLFVVMLLCIAGNTGCLVVKYYMKRDVSFSPADLQMTQWHVMDLLMGLYIAIIVIADWIYRHRYFSIRHLWTASVTCRMAGLLASVSYQATAFLVCVVTVHSLCTACPHRVTIQVTRRHTLLLCVLVWTVAVGISMTPVVIREWQFHGHTGMCLAVLTTISQRSGKAYALALQIVLHVILAVLVMAGQGLLHWLYFFHDTPDLSVSQRFLQMAAATSTSSQVVLDCGRRLTFCVISVLAYSGVPLPEYIHVAFAILVLPVSAAMDPLLCVLNMVIARRRHHTLQRVLQRLHRQLALHKPL